MPLNSTYWAPVDAHDPVRVQQIMLGLTKTSAEKMDLALARDTKICESFIWLLILNQVAKKSEIVQSGIRNFFGFCNKYLCWWLLQSVRFISIVVIWQLVSEFRFSIVDACDGFSSYQYIGNKYFAVLFDA